MSIHKHTNIQINIFKNIFFKVDSDPRFRGLTHNMKDEIHEKILFEVLSLLKNWKKIYRNIKINLWFPLKYSFFTAHNT